MGRKTHFIVAAGIGFSLLLATAGSDTVEVTDAPAEGSWTHVCVCVAHGSHADPGRGRKAKPTNPGGGKGGGGGGKTKECYKTFGSWAKTSLAVYVHVDALGAEVGAPPGLSSNGLLASYLDDAIEEWGCYSGLGEGVTFTTTTDPNAADITLSWGDEGSRGTLGVTYLYGFGSTITHADIVMNSNQQAFGWTTGPALDEDDVTGCNTEVDDGVGGLYDLRSVTIHEVGHAFGMDHAAKRCRSNDSCYGETMFPCTGPAEYSRRALDPGDQAGIESLYPSPSD